MDDLPKELLNKLKDQQLSQAKWTMSTRNGKRQLLVTWSVEDNMQKEKSPSSKKRDQQRLVKYLKRKAEMLTQCWRLEKNTQDKETNTTTTRKRHVKTNTEEACVRNAATNTENTASSLDKITSQRNIGVITGYKDNNDLDLNQSPDRSNSKTLPLLNGKMTQDKGENVEQELPIAKTDLPQPMQDIKMNTENVQSEKTCCICNINYSPTGIRTLDKSKTTDDEFTAPVFDSPKYARATRHGVRDIYLQLSTVTTGRRLVNLIRVRQECEHNRIHVKLIGQHGDTVGVLEEVLHESKLLKTLVRELNQELISKRKLAYQLKDRPLCLIDRNNKCKMCIPNSSVQLKWLQKRNYPDVHLNIRFRTFPHK